MNSIYEYINKFLIRFYAQSKVKFYSFKIITQYFVICCCIIMCQDCLVRLSSFSQGASTGIHSRLVVLADRSGAGGVLGLISHCHGNESN